MSVIRVSGFVVSQLHNWTVLLLCEQFVSFDFFIFKILWSCIHYVHCTRVQLSYVINFYLLTYVLTYLFNTGSQTQPSKVELTVSKFSVSIRSVSMNIHTTYGL